MVDEVVRCLGVSASKVFVDGTLGDGGHSEAILEASSPDGVVVGVDADNDAIETARERLRRFGTRFEAVQGNFRRLRAVVRQAACFGGSEPSADGILLDLGVSTRQLMDPERGFSFQREGPLDMRMDRAASPTAADLVAGASVEELERLFRENADVRGARRVARRIVEAGSKRPFRTTTELSDCIASALGGRRGRLHPATRAFMALRMSVNDEAAALDAGLQEAANLLRARGRLVVLTYHSGEDRRVKYFFRDLAKAEGSRFAAVLKKPLTPTVRERRENPRSRSAKLRALEARA